MSAAQRKTTIDKIAEHIDGAEHRIKDMIREARGELAALDTKVDSHLNRIACSKLTPLWIAAGSVLLFSAGFLVGGWF